MSLSLSLSSNQLSESAHVAMTALQCSLKTLKSKVSHSLIHWPKERVTRSPIELSWTAKKGKRRVGQMVNIKMMRREGSCTWWCLTNHESESVKSWFCQSLTPMLNSWSRRPSSYCTLSSMFIHLSSLFLILYIVDQRGMGTFFAKIKILSPKWKLREHFTEKENIWS